MDKDRCEGCRCTDCRWRGAGSHCYYNDHGPEASRCSWCMAQWYKGGALETFKQEAALCRGYQEKWRGKA